MPQIQILPRRDETLANALGGVGEGASNFFKKKAEQDAVKRLLESQQGPERDVVQSLIAGNQAAPDMPFEQLLGGVTNIASLKKSAEIEKAATRERQLEKMGAEAVAKKYNMTPEEVLFYGASNVAKMDLAKVKNAQRDEREQRLADLLQDPNFQNMSADEKQVEFAKNNLLDKVAMDFLGREREAEIKKEEMIDKSYLPHQKYIDQVREGGRKSMDEIRGAKNLRQILSTGKVGPENLRNFTASYLPVDNPLRRLMETPENQLFTSGVYTFIKSKTKDFGYNFTDRDLKLVQEKTASAHNVNQVNEDILDMLESESIQDLRRQEIMDSILDEAEVEGRRVPRNLEAEVESRLRNDPISREATEIAMMRIVDRAKRVKGEEGGWIGRINPENGREDRMWVNSEALKDFEGQEGYTRISI